MRTTLIEGVQKMTKDTGNLLATGASKTGSLLSTGVNKTGDLFSNLFDTPPEKDKDDEGMLPGSEYDKTRYLVNKKATSKDFMDELTYSVPVKDLYQVLKVCTSHEGCGYQALLLEIVNDELRTMYNEATHLIQVRNMRGELIF